MGLFGAVDDLGPGVLVVLVAEVGFLARAALHEDGVALSQKAGRRIRVEADSVLVAVRLPRYADDHGLPP